jgi:hypothetical protein
MENTEEKQKGEVSSLRSVRPSAECSRREGGEMEAGMSSEGNHGGASEEEHAQARL